MRTLFSYVLIGLLTFGLMINEAAAKRFGGGRSFGVQRAHNSMFSSNKAANTSFFGKQSNSRINQSKSKWGGMLGGLLIGGLLASLFMGHGVTSGIITWLLLGAALFFIVSYFRRKMNPGLMGAHSNRFNQNPFSNFAQSFANNNSAASADKNESEYPTGFVTEHFLRDAKVTFMRLQTAYDQKNIEDLTVFTAPEVFGEIKMQLEERGGAPNKTEVVTLKAELLDVSKQFDSILASVRFTGSIKENQEPITQLNEIWHFRQFRMSKDWVVGGIQQEVIQP